MSDGNLHEKVRATLAENYGIEGSLELAPGVSEVPAGTVVAALDFSGRALRGTMGLRLTPELAKQTYRAATREGDELDPDLSADWLCELANQLTGRLKNKLRRYGVSFSSNVPRVLTTFPAEELERAIHSRFVCNTGRLSGYLDVLIGRGVQLQTQRQKDESPSEGELVLF